MKKAIRIISLILLVIVIIMIAFFIDTYLGIKRGDFIKWDNQWYSKEQIKEKFPPQYINTPAKNTPEEVYKIFRDALLAGDIEKALEQITVESRNNYNNFFYDKEVLNKFKDSLPEKFIFKKRSENENNLYFDWDRGDGYEHTLSFVKDINGYWKIDQI